MTAAVTQPVAGSLAAGFTSWRIELGRFQFFVQLTTAELRRLKDQIDWQTKSNVETPGVKINGIPGVTHGDYGPPRTWIDWWFKRGDTTLCLCLQSVDFPVTLPTEEEASLHRAIIASVSQV